MATEDIQIFIESKLEDVNRPITCKNESMGIFIGILEITTLSLLEINKTTNNCHGINDLTTILAHLAAIAGTQITTEEVQKYTNRDIVFNHC